MRLTHNEIRKQLISIINNALVENGLDDIEYTTSISETGVLISFIDTFEMTAEEIRENGNK